MKHCTVCGNAYDKAFEVTTAAGDTYIFDSFECAIHALAPTCAVCGIKIIGHGLEAHGTMYCCDHCAEKDGVTDLQDRVSHE